MFVGIVEQIITILYHVLALSKFTFLLITKQLGSASPYVVLAYQHAFALHLFI